MTQFTSAFSSRRLFLALIFSGLMALLAVRLVDVQILQGDEFRTLAEANRVFTVPLPRQRGVITDRFGTPLVHNDAVYFQVADPSLLYGETTQISRDAALALSATESGSMVVGIRRRYPLGEIFSQVLGYAGQVTAEELVADRSLRMTDIVGKQGMEEQFDFALRGQHGRAVYEVSASGRKQRLINEEAGTPGLAVETTLDPFLSSVAWRALGDNRGSVVIADVETGEVLTVVSAPAFDPNLLTARSVDPAIEAARQASISAALQDPARLFFNRALSGTYPPGSVFKLVTALAALDSGTMDRATTVVDEGILRVGEFSYANWYYTQYGRTEGPVSLRRAIARSNDIYFYKAAEAAGPERVARFANVLGLGEKTGMELVGEASGLIPTPEWKEKTRGERWFLGNTYHMGIGQGDVLVTPVQVAQMTQAVMNGGVKCSLHMHRQTELACSNVQLDSDDVDEVHEGLVDACSSGGTAFPFFAWNDQRRSPDHTAAEALSNGAVACKTGTAEFGATDARGYKQTHGWFTMTVGIDQLINASESAVESGVGVASESALAVDYQNRDQWRSAIAQAGSYPRSIVITVLVESDETRPYREGSRDAGPVAKAILDWIAGETPVVTPPAAAVPPEGVLAE